MNALLLSLALLAPQDDTYALRWVPKKGDVHSFQYTRNLTDGRNTRDHRVLLTWEVNMAIPEGFQIISSTSGVIRIGNQTNKQDIADQQRQIEFSPDGKMGRILRGDMSPESYKHERLLHFKSPDKPVKVGERWKFSWLPHSTNRTPATDINYRLVKVANGVATVEFTYKEHSVTSPQSANGRWLIDVKTGVPREMTCSVRGFVGNPALSGDIELQRT